MAGMFYSLEEAAEKLNVSHEKIQELVEQGKLREFPDGTNQLFKVKEVDSLAADLNSEAKSETTEQTEQPESDEEELSLADTSQSRDQQEETDLEDIDLDELELDEDSQEKPSDEQDAEPLELDEEQQPDEEQKTPDQQDSAEELSLADTSQPQEQQQEEPDLEDIDLDEPDEEQQPDEHEDEQMKEELELEDTDLQKQQPAEKQEPSAEEQPEEEISLEETGQEKPPAVEDTGDELVVSEDQTEDQQQPDETAITEEGINVLGDTDTDYQLADTKSETTAGDEESLEEIEEDVNLDSFGSGSGLLDLSLQADDTSLGGILDEIYAPEGEDQPEASEKDVAEEAEQMVPEETAETQAEPAAAAAASYAYAEPEPDTASKALGVMMFLPLIAMTYMAVVTLASLSGTVPGILSPVQGFIWYIMGTLAVVAVIIAVGGIVMNGREPKPAKSKSKDKKSKKK